MRRALQLAAAGLGHTSPNPMVGAVITGPDGEIIGEGWHRRYGGPHAEVEAVRSVKRPELLRQSTMYVTLEPCAHYGKTPPCADMIVNKGIPRVIIGCLDPFAKVDGRGMQRLLDAGIEVVSGVLEQECRELNRIFITAHTHRRPYVILKWAESADGYLGRRGQDGHPEPVAFSSAERRLQVQLLRSRMDAILVGMSTVRADNPRLDVRIIDGRSPLRVVLDDSLPDINPGLHVLSDGRPTLLITRHRRQGLPESVEQVEVNPNSLSEVLRLLYGRNITSLLVEGGPTVLGSFIEAGLYDEVQIEHSVIRLDDAGYGKVTPAIPGATDFAVTPLPGGNRLLTMRADI